MQAQILRSYVRYFVDSSINGLVCLRGVLLVRRSGTLFSSLCALLTLLTLIPVISIEASAAPAAPATTNSAATARPGSKVVASRHKKRSKRRGNAAFGHKSVAKSGPGKPLVLQKPQLDSSLTTTNEIKPVISDPESDRLLRLGALKHREGQLSEAEENFRQVLGRDPQNVDAFFNLGALAEGRGDLITALGHYRAAHALSPRDVQIGEAVQSLEGQLKRNPSLSVAPPFAGAVALPVANPGFRAVDRTVAVQPFTLPESDPAPVQDGQVFQLRSNQNAMTPPVLPVGNATPPTLTVGAPRPSTGKVVARAALGMALNIGASYALRGTGLHCPVCRLVRLRF